MSQRTRRRAEGRARSEPDGVAARAERRQTRRGAYEALHLLEFGERPNRPAGGPLLRPYRPNRKEINKILSSTDGFKWPNADSPLTGMQEALKSVVNSGLFERAFNDAMFPAVKMMGETAKKVVDSIIAASTATGSQLDKIADTYGIIRKDATPPTYALAEDIGRSAAETDEELRVRIQALCQQQPPQDLESTSEASGPDTKRSVSR